MRQILYKKEEPKRLNIVPVSSSKIEQKNEPEKMAEWIKNATLLNIAGLCREAGMDRGNFDKYLLRGKIPEKYVSAILPIITKYGYK